MTKIEVIRDLVQAIDDAKELCPSASILREERLLDALDKAKDTLIDHGYRLDPFTGKEWIEWIN